MQTSWRNICKIGRQAAGMTQERWAEALEVSVEAVRGYEAGLYMPSDDLALRMADIAAMPVLSHWHLLNKSAAARALIPDVKYLGLSMATVRLLAAMGRFQAAHRGDRLLEIAADGQIDALEKLDYREIMAELEGITTAALELKYAKEEDPDAYHK